MIQIRSSIKCIKQLNFLHVFLKVVYDDLQKLNDCCGVCLLNLILMQICRILGDCAQDKITQNYMHIAMLYLL